MNGMPNFAAWNIELLAQYAKDAYDHINLQNERIQQLTDDNKLLLNEIRKHLTKDLHE
jgi:hypothetical protein